MKWNDFLNPRSMLTPGIAGSVVMVIANTLWIEFSLPQKWSALILSFLLIVPILIKFAASWVENVIYFTFNGLIVFALAVNTNFAGRKLQDISISSTNSNKTVISQRLSTAFKISLASSSPIDDEAKIKKINNIQLASNDQNTTTIIGDRTTTTITTTTKENQIDSTEQKKKKKEKEKNKDDNKQENKKFFDPWFGT